MMAHNYYLYESGGQLNILPWDYNLALGGMSGTDATSVVNDAIDNAFSGTDFFDTLMENEEYQAQFYAYLQQLVDEYLLGDGFEEFYARTRSQIDSLVETDPTAFYTYDEYVTAVETLYEVVQLRGESIGGQLNGMIPSTESEQRNSDALIDASHLDLSVMGSMNMGDGLREWNTNDSGGEDSLPENETSQAAGTDATSFDKTNVGQLAASLLTTDSVDAGDSFDPSQFGGELPEDFDPSQFSGELPEGFDQSQLEGGTQEGVDTGTASDGSSGGGNRQSQFDMGAMSGMSSGGSSSTTLQNLVTYGICFGILICALIFATLYRRKPRKR